MIRDFKGKPPSSVVRTSQDYTATIRKGNEYKYIKIALHKCGLIIADINFSYFINFYCKYLKQITKTSAIHKKKSFKSWKEI